MTQHHSPIVADAVTDFILYPTSDELRQSPDDPLVLAKARRTVDLFGTFFKLCWPSTGILSLSTALIMTVYNTKI